jgi:hypothetical protein
MPADHAPIASLHAIFDAAKQFGLSEADVWQAVNECFCSDDVDESVGDCLEELVIALAHRILEAAAA